MERNAVIYAQMSTFIEALRSAVHTDTEGGRHQKLDLGLEGG